MPLLVLAVGLLLAACGAPTPAPASPPMSAAGDTLALFDFGPDAPAWRVVNDGVMGGRSQGFGAIEEGTLRFTGEVVTDGGGFTSVNTPKRVDLSAYDAVELRVRGGGRTFEIDLDDGTRRGGRTVSRRGAFSTTDDWQTVRVAFADLRTSVFGRSVEADPFDPAALREVGLYILDGQDGPFRLEVDWIRAVRTDG